jgi:glycosyltransferase involved in cell wall biosynthesis
MKIAIIGSYPPPYGGISIHVQRLYALLKHDGHDVFVFKNITAPRWLIAARGKWFKYDVVHFHDASVKGRILIGLLGALGLNVVLTIHGDSLKNQLAYSGWLKRSLLTFSLQHIGHIVGVKAEIRDIVLSLGVKPSQVSVINAYLPPILEKEDLIPRNIVEFAELHTHLIVANGFGVIPLSKETDLYGIEMTMALCARLVKNYPRLGCLFFLAQIGDQKRYDDLTVKISRLGLNDHFRFIIGESLVPPLKQATIFVRPTFQDGYGVSVTEALYLGVPALASDVCEREKGAIIFKCGDADDFYWRTRQILDNDETIKQTLQAIKPMSAYGPLLAVYQRVANKR